MQGCHDISGHGHWLRRGEEHMICFSCLNDFQRLAAIISPYPPTRFLLPTHNFENCRSLAFFWKKASELVRFLKQGLSTNLSMKQICMHSTLLLLSTLGTSQSKVQGLQSETDLRRVTFTEGAAAQRAKMNWWWNQLEAPSPESCWRGMTPSFPSAENATKISRNV